MELFTYLYDSLLVYSPNVFFITAFLGIALIILILIKTLTILFLKIEMDVVKIALNKNIKNVHMPKYKFSLLRVTKYLFTKIDNILTVLQLQIEKVIKKIQKEVFIDE